MDVNYSYEVLPEEEDSNLGEYWISNILYIFYDNV